MDSVILFYHTLTRNTRTVLPNILSEILLRVLLLSGLSVLHLKYQPQARYIIAEEMLNEYKKPRRDSFIHPWLMIAVTIFIPFLILSLPLVITRNYIETIQALLGWSLSILLNAILTELLKITVCRPRPDFFYRCFPNGPENIELNKNQIRDIIEGRKSFPSGHSSFAFCSLGFLSIWLNGRFPTRGRSVGVDAISVIPVFLATLIGASRCFDNHHHWQDVLAGAVLGLSTSCISYKLYCKPLNNREQRDM